MEAVCVYPQLLIFLLVIFMQVSQVLYLAIRAVKRDYLGEERNLLHLHFSKQWWQHFPFTKAGKSSLLFESSPSDYANNMVVQTVSS